MPMEEEKVDIKKPEGEKPAAPPEAGGTPKIEAPPMGQEPNPPAAPVATQMDREPSDKDKQLFAKMCSSHPHLGPMMKEYAAKSGGGDPATPAPVAAGGAPNPQGMAPPAAPPMNPQPMGMGAAVPSGANTNIPKPMGAYSMSSDVERYEARIADLERSNRVMRYAADYRALQDEGYRIDVAAETHRDQDYTQEQHDQRVKDIKQYAMPLPVGRMPRIDDSHNPNKGANTRMTKEQMHAALKYQRENPGIPTEQAIKYVMNGTAVHG